MKTRCEYQRKEISGFNYNKHRLIWFEYFGTIPLNWIVHHINGNKLDNTIENLACMDIKMHNKIHAHKAWNKGIKAPSISKGKLGHLVSAKQVQKQQNTWKIKYINSMQEIHNLYKKGLSLKEVAIKLGLTIDQTRNRHAKFMRCYCVRT